MDVRLGHEQGTALGTGNLDGRTREQPLPVKIAVVAGRDKVLDSTIENVTVKMVNYQGSRLKRPVVGPMYRGAAPVT
jgi:hypothetical protein